jgi:hypothetical protein
MRVQNIGRDILVLRFEGYVYTFYFVLYSSIVELMWPKHVAADTLYSIRCVDGLFVVLSESTTE